MHALDQAAVFPPKAVMPAICRINDLPTELFIAILVTGAKSAGSVKQQHSFPLRIFLVCRRWRNVCMDTPEMWTSLLVRPSKFPATITDYVRRSGSHPLQIQLAMSRGPRIGHSFHDTRAQTSWKELLLPIASRVKKVYADTSSVCLLDLSSLLLKMLGNVSGVLVFSVSSSVKRGSLENVALPLRRQAFVLPQLRSLHLDGCVMDDWRHVEYSCANIEVLHFFEFWSGSVPITLSEILEVLQASPKLRTLELGYQSISPPSIYEEIGTVMLENLESLVMQSYTHRDLNLLFSHIVVPRLKTLTIGGFPGDRDLFLDQDIPINLPLLETLTISQPSSALRIVILFAPFARHIKLFQDDGDGLIDGLLRSWGRTLSPLPLEKLTTQGVSSAALSRLGGARRMVPSLREIVVLDEGRPIKKQTLRSKTGHVQRNKKRNKAEDHEDHGKFFLLSFLLSIVVIFGGAYFA